MSDYDDTYRNPALGGGDDTHPNPAVPPEFIPDGYTALTDYTKDNLPELAESIATDTGAPRDEILESLRKLVEYKVPVVEADRSVRVKYRGEGE